ncbi:hypothetical protein OG21DRAFT_272621 [Imleria badia]|nr:hypothetical protein OG21DRAFT_272621 [Imleria badia]
MNRFRKPRPTEPTTMAPLAANKSNSTATSMSRTMHLAVSGVKVSASRGDDSSSVSTANLQKKGTWFSAPLAVAPRTKVEQYWATRALVAETLLSTRDRHQGELEEVRRMEERKRETLGLYCMPTIRGRGWSD